MHVHLVCKEEKSVNVLTAPYIVLTATATSSANVANMSVMLVRQQLQRNCCCDVFAHKQFRPVL